MKIGLFSDLHITNRNPKYIKDKYGVSELIKRQISFIDHFLEKCLQEGVELIVFCGDITDDEHLNPVEQTALNTVVGKIQNACQLSESNLEKAFFVSGNHTISDSENDYSILSAVDQIAGDCIDCRYKPDKQDAIEYNDELQLSFFPYQTKYELIDSALGTWSVDYRDKTDKFMLGFFHFPIVGADLDNGFPAKNGVTLEHFEKKDDMLLVGGDFHRPQQVGENVYYVGAPFDLKFGDYLATNRGFRILDIDLKSGEYDFNSYQNPFNKRMWKGSVKEFKKDIISDNKSKAEIFAKIDGKLEDKDREFLKNVEEENEFLDIDLPVMRNVSDEQDRNDVEIMKEEEVEEDEVVREKLSSRTEDEVADRAIEIFSGFSQGEQ